MIQPSPSVQTAAQKERFYQPQHCALITSSLSNLDHGRLKAELQKLWKLSGGFCCWELRRECGRSFLACFSSEDSVVSCLKHPRMETLVDGREVKLTVTS
jgi:hypothetical protein